MLYLEVFGSPYSGKGRGKMGGVAHPVVKVEGALRRGVEADENGIDNH